MQRSRHVTAGQRGVTGVETSIILTAFVVVASVFAFTILSTGLFSAEKSKETVYAGFQETRSSLKPRGNVIAHKGKTTTDTVYKLTFVVSSALAGEPTDLTPPYTADDTGDDPDISPGARYVTVVQYQDQNQALSDVPWTVKFVGSNDGDNVLEGDETAEITVWLLVRDYNVASATDDNGVKLYTAGGGGITVAGNIPAPYRKFSVRLQPPIGTVLTIERTLPVQFDTVMDLR